MKPLLLLFLVGSLCACASSAYYAHLASGQQQLLSGRESIASLLQDPDTEPALRQRLLLVQSVRDFASDQLTLPSNDSYRYYVDLDRPYAVWNVYAAAEFSVEAKEWCFPIAGCVAYRGYFDEQKALDFTQSLDEQKLDYFVGGVAAYSTLGWFDDPVLNTFIDRDELRLAGLIFHELAHQQLYLKGDTAFNESFARAVEIEGVRRWLAYQQRDDLMADYLLDQQLHQDFVTTLLRARDSLATLYQLPISDEQKRRRKAQRLEQIQRQDYAAFKQRWDGTTQYDGWMSRDFNNAKLATLANYHQWLSAFGQLIADNQGNMADFYRDVAVVSRYDREKRQHQLQLLSSRASATLVKNKDHSQHE